MSSVRKFLFDESFDAESPARARARAAGGGGDFGYDDDPYASHEPQPPPPPTVFSQADVDAARQAAFAEGEQAGLTAGFERGFAEGRAAGATAGAEAGRLEAEATIAGATAQALTRVGEGVDHLLAERAATNAAREDQPVRIALALVRKLMPELTRRGGLGEVEAVVRACLADLIDEPRLVIRVAEEASDEARAHLDAEITARGFGAKLMVLGDPGLEVGDCRVEWAEGGAERDTDQLLRDIENRLARLASGVA